MTAYPTRGQQAPAFWDEQLKDWIEEQPVAPGDFRNNLDTRIADQTEGKADLVAGKVAASQLPSYVDDVVEYPDFASLPATGTSGLIYITVDDGHQYRWTGTAYSSVSSPPTLVTQAEAEVGTSTVIKSWTPERVAQAIAALGGDPSIEIADVDGLTDELSSKVQSNVDNLELVVSDTDPGPLAANQVWIVPSDEALLTALADAKGDTFVASGNDAIIRKAVGADKEVYTADAASTGGVAWKPARRVVLGSVIPASISPGIVNTNALVAAATIATGSGIQVGDRLTLRAGWDFLNDSGAVQSIEMVVKIGSTTIADYTQPSIPDSTSRYAGVLEIEFVVAALSSAADSVRASGEIHLRNTTQGAGGTLNDIVIVNTAPQDLTTTKDIVLSFKPGVANANLSVRLHSATLYRDR